MEFKYRIKTYEFIYCINSITAFIIIGFIVAIFVFSVNPLALKIMFGLDLIAIPFFLIVYRGKIELILVDDKISIHWVKKPFFKKVFDKTIYTKNIIKICTDRDSVMSHQSHIMCQIVQTNGSFIFYVADSVQGHKELSKLKAGLRKITQIENQKRTEEKRIQLKLNV